MKYFTSGYLTLVFLLCQFSNLSAQLSISLVYGVDCQFTCLLGSSLVLNEEAELLDDGACTYSTDFSNVKPGVNTLSVDSEISVYKNISTIDLVLLAQGIIFGAERFTYSMAVAGDLDNDLVISTDDLILLNRIRQFQETDLASKVKICDTNRYYEPMIGLELDADHSTYSFESDSVQVGTAKELLLIKVGDLDSCL